MITYYDRDRVFDSLRLHPYEAGSVEQSGYVDFTKQPERITTALEDFLPYAETSAVQSFYELLKYVNGADSHLQSCDCALRPPSPHTDTNSDLALCIHGRLFLMYRDEKLNCLTKFSHWLCSRLQTLLIEIDADLSAREAVIGFSLNPALHTDLANGNWTVDGQFSCAIDDPAHGLHTMLSFWAYGESADDAFLSLDRLFRNIQTACARLDREITAALVGSARET